MALKPSPPQHPGPTAAGSNQPSQGAGWPTQDVKETDDERKEREFLEKKVQEQEKENARAEERAGEVPVAAFSITNNGTGDLDIYQLAVAPDGMVLQRYMRSLKPREVLTVDSPMNAIRIRAAVPNAVPVQVIHGFA